MKLDLNKNNKADLTAKTAISLRILIVLINHLFDGSSTSSLATNIGWVIGWLFMSWFMFFVNKKALIENRNWAINTGLIAFSYWVIVESVGIYPILMEFINAIFNFALVEIIVDLIMLSYVGFCIAAIFSFLEHKNKIKNINEKDSVNI